MLMLRLSSRAVSPAAALGGSTGRRLSGWPAFAVAASVIGLALYASATPTPLYAVYQSDWDFSTLVLTLVYGVYCFGVLGALLVAGSVSDEVGRRPTLTVALAGLVGASVLFALAGSVAWLFAARLVQGIATGVALGAAGAAMLDLHPRGDAGQVGLVTAVVSVLGVSAGAIFAALLVEYGPAPKVLPFVVVGSLFAAALAGVVALREPVRDASGLRLKVHRPRVPAALRGAFALSALAVLASWSIAGVYLSLGPSLVSDLLGSESLVAGGLAILAFFVPSALSQLRWHRVAASRAVAGGAATLAVGTALTVAAVSTGSAAPFVIASVVAGTGFGIAFLGALRSLAAVIPNGHRAGVMSAFYVVAYLSLSLPAIGAGLVAPELGIEGTYGLFGSLVVAIAIAVAVLASRAASAAARVPEPQVRAA